MKQQLGISQKHAFEWCFLNLVRKKERNKERKEKNRHNNNLLGTIFPSWDTPYNILVYCTCMYVMCTIRPKWNKFSPESVIDLPCRKTMKSRHWERGITLMKILQIDP